MAGNRVESALLPGSLYEPVFDESWSRADLYSLATWINGMAFRNFQFTPTGKQIIKIAEIKNGISGQTKFTDATYDPCYLVTAGDMLFSWSGQPETSLDVSWWRGSDGWLNQHIFKVLPDKKRCLPEFFYYLLKYLKPHFIAIARNKQTTGLGHVTKADLERITVRIPSIPLQREIAGILGALDDKIELNRRMNETLEAMARAIFKSWFVDFDPVRAKSEGRDTGLPSDIATLFPDSFVDSELRKIPKGWKVESLGDILELAYGKGLKEDDRSIGSVPVYGSNGQIGWHSESLVNGPGIVVGRKGNPGFVTWVHTDFFPIDTTFYVVPKSNCPSLYYLYHALGLQDLPSLSADSAVPGLNRNAAYMSNQVVPPKDILKAFDSLVAPLRDKKHDGQKESATLSTIRDSLLPKLMSGEIHTWAT